MKINEILTEAANPAQQAAIAISLKKAHKKPKTESTDLEEEFDLIESIIERLAQHTGVDAEVIWEDLETLTEDELYAFAVTSEPIMESTRKGEYGRVLDALGLYYPRISMEELNTPGYYKVIANKADVPVEYAAQVIDGFVNDDRYYDDEEQGVAEGSLNELSTGTLKRYKKSAQQDIDSTNDAGIFNDTDIDRMGRRLRGIPRATSKIKSNNKKEQGVAEAEPVPGKYSGHFYDAKLLPNGDYEVIKINSKKDDKGNTNPLDLKVGSIVPKGKAHSLQYANDGGMFDEINRAERSAQFRAQQKGVAEDWQKANKRDRTDGMSQKAVNAYRRENPGSKLKTAVTTKPSKLKKGGKASKRRKSYCSRSRGQMKMHSISCAKTPDKAICKARRRWNC